MEQQVKKETAWTRFLYMKEKGRFRVIIIVGAAIPIYFTITILYLKAYSLLFIPVMLVLSTLLNIRLAKSRRFAVAFINTMVCTLIFAITFSVVLGVEYAYYVYLIDLIPISFMYVYTQRDYRVAMRCALLATVVALVGFMGCAMFDIDTPLFGVDLPFQVHIIRTCNFLLEIIIMFLAIALLVIELHEANMKIQEMSDRFKALSDTDMLTGLSNRRYLEQWVQEKVSGGAHYSVAMLDIDFFKQVNDTYGHDCGDEVLRQLSATVRALIRQSDCACRWGGEEILMVLANTDGRGAADFSQRLLEQVRAAKLLYHGKEITYTVTIGVAEYEPGEAFEHTVRRADKKLYQGKREGRNRCVF